MDDGQGQIFVFKTVLLPLKVQHPLFVMLLSTQTAGGHEVRIVLQIHCPFPHVFNQIVSGLSQLPRLEVSV